MKLKQIGKGSFSTVYKLNKNEVLIKSYDYTKECMANGLGFTYKLFPSVKNTDLSGEYTMKYYPKCNAPKAQLNKLSYNRYKLLRDIMLKTMYTENKYDGYSVLHKAFSSITDKYLRDALLDALDGLSNYGSDISFEISPRNISFTKSGRLILLDVFFFRTQLEEKRSK